MKTIKRLCLTLLIFVNIFWIVGCKESEPQATVSADETEESEEVSVPESESEPIVLNVAYTATPAYMDPARGKGENDLYVYFNVYEALVRISENGDIENLLADDFTVSDDGLIYTFTLRDDVIFADGAPLTAEDIKYSMDRLLAIGEGFAFIFTDIVSETNVVDDLTVEFVLTKPFGPFISALTNFFIVNKELCEEHTLTEGLYGDNGDFATEWLVHNSAGSGPYIGKDMTIEVDLTLIKNENYWGGISEKAPDQVYIIRENEAANTKMLVGAGDVDQMHGLMRQTTLEAVLEVENWESVSIPQQGLNFFEFHTQKPPTDDVHIRRAISYAVDKEPMKKVYNNTTETYGPVPPTLFGAATSGLETYEYDLGKAQEEIALSAYADNLADYPVTISYLPGGDTGKLGLLLAENLSNLGFTVEILEAEWALFCKNAETKETSPNITNIFVSTLYAEAGSILEFKYSSWTTGGWNQNEWLEDDKFDTMILDALGTIDDDERESKYQEIQEYIVNEVVPSAYVFINEIKPAWNTAVFSWPAGEGRVHPNSYMNFYYANYEMKDIP